MLQHEARSSGSGRRTWTQYVNELKLHHSRNAIMSITASFPFARVQIDTGMSGGGVHQRRRHSSLVLECTFSR